MTNVFYIAPFGEVPEALFTQAFYTLKRIGIDFDVLHEYHFNPDFFIRELKCPSINESESIARYILGDNLVNSIQYYLAKN